VNFGTRKEEIVGAEKGEGFRHELYEEQIELIALVTISENRSSRGGDLYIPVKRGMPVHT